MMKKLFLITSMLLVACFAQASEVKLAVVDMQVILQKAPQVSEINNKLTSKFEPRKKTILQAQKTLKEEVDNLNKNSAVLGTKEREQLKNKIITDRNNLQTMIVSFQRDYSQVQNQSLQAFSKQLERAVGTVAKKSNIDLVLQKGVILFSREGLDITQQVLLALK